MKGCIKVKVDCCGLQEQRLLNIDHILQIQGEYNSKECYITMDFHEYARENRNKEGYEDFITVLHSLDEISNMIETAQ